MIRITYDFPYIIPQEVLDFVSIETTTNSCFLTSNVRSRGICIEFKTISDLVLLNTTKYCEVWDQAVIHDHGGCPIITPYTSKAIKRMNIDLCDFIQSINDSMLNFSLFLELKCIYTNQLNNRNVLFECAKKMALGTIDVAINRGESVSDVVTAEYLSNFSCSDTIKTPEKVRDCLSFLISCKPKKKKNANNKLFLKKGSDIVLVIPTNAYFKLTIIN